MFNVINNKFMLFVNQLLIILLIALSCITMFYSDGKEGQVLLLFVITFLPYAMAVSRTRDFMQVDSICILILLVMFILNIIGFKCLRLYNLYIYSLISLGIVLFGYLFQIILYSVVFKLSGAISEYKRFSSAIESTSFIHSINIFINIYVFTLINKITKVNNLFTMTVVSIVLLRAVTKLIMFAIVNYDTNKIGGADEDIKK